MSSAEPRTKIDFMKMKYFWLVFSLLQVLFASYVWVTSGSHKYGIDFLGGNDLVLKFNNSVSSNQIREKLVQGGLGGAIVQAFEAETNEFSIRVKGDQSKNNSILIQEVLKDTGGGFTVLKNDYVGPIIGDKIKKDGIKAVVISIICLLIYIGWRFEFVYGLGAVIAVFHDIVISAGLFIFLGGEIGAGALAALLTILGYSINDTIITYDRIRENLSLKGGLREFSKVGSISLKDLSFEKLINLSINQTLSRTLLTAGTTLFSSTVLYLFGGGAISELSLMLTIGIAIGTYSSIFVASPLLLFLSKKK